MKKFSVMFERRVPEYLDIEIEAKDWDEAREIVAKMEIPNGAKWERQEWNGEASRSFMG